MSTENMTTIENKATEGEPKKVDLVKELVMQRAKDFKKEGLTMTQPGSLKYLLFGSEPSEQSLSVKMGKVGEDMFKLMIKINPNIKLIKCGVQNVGNKKKDIDLAWMDPIKKIIYIRECKGNMELDTEKLPATFEKVKQDIVPFLETEYPDYKIDCGILNWSVYSRKIVKKTLNHIKSCEDNGVKVDHVEDFLKNINFDWDEEDYYNFFREVGKLFRE
tara:strand:+ start:417 stop:1070 length:654 start_codon:yes stop_codon:yes gene_type:complete